MDQRTSSGRRPEPAAGGAGPERTQPLPAAPVYGQAPYAPAPTSGSAPPAAPRPRRTVGVGVTAVVAATALVVGLLTGGGAVAVAYALHERGPGWQQGPGWSDGGRGLPGQLPDGFGRDPRSGDDASAQEPSTQERWDEGSDAEGQVG